MKDAERTLLYLLKIFGPTGRQTLKDEMMERVATDGKVAHDLLEAINKLECGLGQLDRMSNDERQRLGLPLHTATEDPTP